MMERRLLIASVASAAFLALYSSLVMRRVIPERPAVPAIVVGVEHQTLSPPAYAAALRPMPSEEFFRIESRDLAVEIGKSSCAIRTAELPRFSTASNREMPRFGSSSPILEILIDGDPVSCAVVSASSGQVILSAADAKHDQYRVEYRLQEPPSLLSLSITQTTDSNAKRDHALTLIGSWSRADQLPQRYNALEAWVVKKEQNGSLKYKKFFGPFRKPINVPRGTPLVALAERYFCLLLNPESGTISTGLIPSTDASHIHVSWVSDNPLPFSSKVYIGPRDYFLLRKSGLEWAFPIGMLGQIGLILLMVLGWIAGITKNYGVALIVFSLLVTTAMSPMTMMSVKSMKKMQELKPQLDRIMAAHKNDQMKSNQAMMELYRKHKISPLSGCLPMVLQMPIFIALFQAMTHFIQLRGQAFLWIKDLSLPDRMAQFPTEFPVFGHYVNLLPILMAGAMMVQTKLSQSVVTSSDQNPTTKMLSGPMMPILFCVMFYNFPSGLVLYWLTNTLLSIVIYRMAYRTGSAQVCET